MQRRDTVWLQSRLEHVINNYFPDLPPGNPISIGWGRRAKRRLGAICNRGRHTTITLNVLFSLTEVPEYVVDAVIAHELAHYVHGFGSGLPRKYTYPHAGGVVQRELADRGLHDLEQRGKEWERTHWARFFERHAADIAVAVDARQKLHDERWDALMNASGARKTAFLEVQLGELATQLRVSPPCWKVDWLYASTRTRGLSYLYKEEPRLRIHGLAALPEVPVEVIRCELASWICIETVGRNRFRIEEQLLNAGLADEISSAHLWRTKHWERFRRARMPF